MKAKVILLASVLLTGCQVTQQPNKVPEQYAQSMSSANQDEITNFSHTRASSARWFNNTNNIAQQGLWDFISEELKMTIPDHASIQQQKQLYLKHKSHLHDVTVRAEPYMYWIVEQIKIRNMPMELVLLPIVESAFNPHVTSPANAAGLWQIIPQTGKSYGLKQNQWYDGRRDVAASTTAALDILQRLNRMFKGDWLLTLAAYNSGEGRVSQAIKANQAKNKATDFWSLSLPKETTAYVPKMLALSDIIKHHKKYGLELPKPNKERALARIEVGQQIELTQAAEMAGLSLQAIKSYNSGYIRGVTSPNGPHYIMVPQTHAVRFKNSLASTKLTPIQAERLAEINKAFENARSTATVATTKYKVKSGDTLSSIAKRLNVKVSDLQRWNNLSGKQVLKIGQTLSIAKQTSKKHNNSVNYTVRKGDSLYSIAKRHGVNINDVMRWNNLSDKKSNIKPGLMLTLYVNQKPTPKS